MEVIPVVNYYIPMEYPEISKTFELPIVVPPSDKFQWNPVDQSQFPVQGFSFSFSLALAAAELGISTVEINS